MNLTQLVTLNRKLKEVILLASATEGQTLSTGRVTIFEDVLKHQPTTVQDIADRTKLAQSFVSKTITGMEQKKFVKLQQSATDKRKVIITFNQEAAGFVRSMSERPIRHSLQQSLPTLDESAIAQVEDMLDDLEKIFQSGHK